MNVDAIVFWTVWDAKKSILEVSDYIDAILFGAQTALRESIGKHMLAEMITERDQLGQELQKILDDKTNPWGITVNSVEIRDVKIPPDLEDAMSRQAQAERERQARIILGTAETEIAERSCRRRRSTRDIPLALHLRAMNMLYEAIKEKGSHGHRPVERRRDDGPRRPRGNDRARQGRAEGLTRASDRASRRQFAGADAPRAASGLTRRRRVPSSTT